MKRLVPELKTLLHEGTVIPAHPLALDRSRRFDERSQAALTRYYLAAGAGGVAVGVHSTQFEIHDPASGLLHPVLALAAEVVEQELQVRPRPFLKIAGVIGRTEQALRETQLAADLGYDAVLLSMAAFRNDSDAAMLAHCREVAALLPLVGFYLQPAVGGRLLGYSLWRAFAEIDNVVAVKIAPFNRYQTIDVVRAVVDAGRAAKIALYTGNDDSIWVDLLTEYHFGRDTEPARMAGGLLGHWAVWTKRAVEQFAALKEARATARVDARGWLALAAQVTDANAALFDAAHRYTGCLPGISHLLAQQGLVQGPWTLNPHEVLSPGQTEEIQRVRTQYPHLCDDGFVAEHLDGWLR